MADIVIPEFMDESAIGQGLAGFDVLYDPTLVDVPERLIAAVAQARALLVRNRTQVRGALLAGARRLEAVGRLGVGLDNIDVVACEARGIAVYPATGANDAAVAEYVIATAMALLRGAYSATPELVAGAWPRTRLVGRETAGKSLGLVGFGAIAHATAARAVGLGLIVCAFDPYIEDRYAAWSESAVAPMAFADLLAAADVVSLHVPLNPGTKGLVDARAIARMKPDAILINTSRGGIVDEAAVAGALRAGRLGGAALDVFEQEPPGPARAALFDGCPNLILTPHIAGVTVESNVRVSWATVDNIRRHLTEAQG